MRLIQIFKIYFPDNGGGIGQVIETVAEGFDRKKQQIIVCQRKPGMPAKIDRYKGIKVVRCRQILDVASTPMSVQYLREVKKRTKNADVVLYHFPYPLADLAVLLGLYSGKLAVWWHCDFVSHKFLAPFYKPLVEHTLKKADLIFVSAQGNIDGSVVLKKYENKCRIIPFSVDDKYLEAGQAYMEAAKTTRDQKIHVLFIGRLVWYKGCDILLEAFSQLDSAKYDLTIIGWGPKKEELESEAQKLGLKNVRFTGKVSEERKMEEIKRSDFLVLPSISEAEAFAIVQLEAMAFGKPVINTRLRSGVPFVSIDGITGITVEPKNVSELQSAIIKLGKDRELRERYGKAAFERVEQEYTREKMLRRIRESIQMLMDNAR